MLHIKMQLYITGFIFDYSQKQFCLQNLKEHNVQLIPRLDPFFYERNKLGDRLKAPHIEAKVINDRRELEQCMRKKMINKEKKFINCN